MKISYESSQDLKWWEDNIDTACHYISNRSPNFQIETDASEMGWGARRGNKSAGGRWSFEESEYHINVLELKAVHLGLKTFCKKSKGPKVIKVLCDNMTAVAYLKHKGGTKSFWCNETAREIWQWCEDRQFWIIPAHIPGIENVEADFESRNFSEDTEWAINRHIFEQVCEVWGFPNIDLFASRNNFQIDNYVSWGPDPGASFIDAFSLDWSEFNYVYIFPPFRLLPRILQKVRMERVKAIIVAPIWMGQPWFTPLQVASKDTWSFPRKANNLQRTEVGMDKTRSLHDVPIRFHLLY